MTPTPELCKNEDRELWRETPDDYYSPSIHVTKDGGIGINVGGTVCVRSLRDWHHLAMNVGVVDAAAIRAAVDDERERLREGRIHDSRFREWKRRSGLNWGDVAEMLNCSVSYVSQIERGFGKFTDEELAILATKGYVP